jgi:sugar phosphate isomerase/epimerase
VTHELSRREVLKQACTLGAAAAMAAPLGAVSSLMAAEKPAKLRFGLCTYQWGADWDLPTLLANLEKAGVFGVELRVEHKHGVSPKLNAAERQEVKKRFADSPVTLVGFGTNQCFDNPAPEKVKLQIEGAKEFVRLSHDCGASGVKVKPNDFHKNVPHEKTIEQVGRSLLELGRFAADFGQQIRLEVHGSCCELPTIKQIIDIADAPNVAVCWNCNKQDLQGEGLASNFDLVKNRLGATLHIHELDSTKFVYPFGELIKLLVKADHAAWALLEGYTKPKDPVAALIAQRKLFEGMVAAAKKA